MMLIQRHNSKIQTDNLQWYTTLQRVVSYYHVTWLYSNTEYS